MTLLSETAARYVRPTITTLIAATTFVFTMMMSAPTAQADDLIVHYDQSQLLRMPRNVANVIIGNPSIADVTVQRGNLLIITGKTFGITNIIALDDERNIIQDQRVIVQRDERRIVNLHKGSQRASFSCSPNCEPTITIGDSEEYFTLVQKHSEAKTQFSQGSAGPSN